MRGAGGGEEGEGGGRRGGGRREKRGREEGEGREKGREGEREKFCARRSRREKGDEGAGGGGKGAGGGRGLPPCPPLNNAGSPTCIDGGQDVLGGHDDTSGGVGDDILYKLLDAVQHVCAGGIYDEGHGVTGVKL